MAAHPRRRRTSKAARPQVRAIDVKCSGWQFIPWNASMAGV